MTDTILSITDLDVRGRPPGGTYVPIVTGVSLSVKKGEVLALIGESGSGKSTISLAAMGFARPGCRIFGGQVANQLKLVFPSDFKYIAFN
jgi:peptide/nickel transport system ATP-binding protein